MCLVSVGLGAAATFGGYEAVGMYCQGSSNCASNCCYREHCASENTCDMNDMMDKFEDSSYCDINQECPNRCCIEGRCYERMKCFWRYDFPILMGVCVILGILLCCFSCFICLKVGCGVLFAAAFIENTANKDKIAREERFDVKRKDFIKYNLIQHDTPIQKPYRRSANEEDSKSTDSEPDEEEEMKDDRQRSGALKPKTGHSGMPGTVNSRTVS
jgi:hypothetical protein